MAKPGIAPSTPADTPIPDWNRNGHLQALSIPHQHSITLPDITFLYSPYGHHCCVLLTVIVHERHLCVTPLCLLKAWYPSCKQMFPAVEKPLSWSRSA
jgi:hypothetical protein